MGPLKNEIRLQGNLKLLVKKVVLSQRNNGTKVLVPSTVALLLRETALSFPTVVNLTTLFHKELNSSSLSSFFLDYVDHIVEQKFA